MACSEPVVAKLYLVPVIGGSIANGRVTIDGKKIITGQVGGIKAGLLTQFSLTEKLYVHTGVLHSVNGFSIRSDYMLYDRRLAIHSIDMPLSIQYKSGEAGHQRLILGIGLYAGINIFTNTDYPRTHLQGYLFSNTDVVPINFGWSSNIGYQSANRVLVTLSFQSGFTNQMRPNNLNMAYRPYHVAVSLAYLIKAYKKAPLGVVPVGSDVP